MAKVLKFKEVNSDVERRMKDFEKLRVKFKADVKKGEAKKLAAGKESKGIFKSISALALCLNLIVVTFGFSWSKPIWDEMHVFVRLSLLLLVMLVPTEWDQISFDSLIK